MIKLETEIPDKASPWRKTWQLPADISAESLPDIDLHYTYFASPISMKIDKRDVIGPNTYAALVDFMLVFAHATRRLNADQDAGISFTENAYRIALKKLGDDVTVEAPHRDITMAVPKRALLEEFQRFVLAAHSLVLREVPDLARHQLIAAMTDGLAPDQAP
ncbi:hypothetical protein [Actinomadura rudentiformis]|uniref:Uncharacterized protein n=1 Tax=Actinomadura rudentiformis TaxID=359158 RepID=A0A6H9YFK8_9ACTN|nr:hypothetical protein [Actinomadura rudentiformis]KAB2340429.1 hypothetical protein F8566_45435 [Actinomadura rudentiformis]